MRKLIVSIVVIAAVAATMPLTAAKKKKRAAPGAFTYYLLALSWAPDFCAQAGGAKNPAECGAGKKIGFVAPGFWPQGVTTRGPGTSGPAIPPPTTLAH